MKRISICLLILFALVGSADYAVAQEQAQKSEIATIEGEKPKSEVDKAVDEAKSRGQTVLGTCIENCDDFDKKSDGRLERGQIVRLPKPRYPAIARAGKAEGIVCVRVLIDLDGKVIAASAQSGHPLLFAVSVKAARESLFTTTKYDGQPVKVTGIIQYNFISQ